MTRLWNTIILLTIFSLSMSILYPWRYELSTTVVPEMKWRNAVSGQMFLQGDDNGKTKDSGGDKAENEKDKGDGEDKGIDNGWDRIFDAPKFG